MSSRVNFDSPKMYIVLSFFSFAEPPAPHYGPRGSLHPSLKTPNIEAFQDKATTEVSLAVRNPSTSPKPSQKRSILCY